MCLLGAPLGEDSLVALRQGKLPDLQALRVHSGTVYRWNRPCFGCAEGKAHLRIENRVLPSGPTVLDEVSNAAFFAGLMSGGLAALGDVSKKMAVFRRRGEFSCRRADRPRRPLYLA